MRTGIEAVLFDFGNTLAAYYRKEDFRPILETGIRNAREVVQQRGLTHAGYECAVRIAIEENRESPDHRVRPLDDRLRRVLQLPDSTSAAVLDEASQAFLQPILDTGLLYDDVLPTLQALRTVGYKMAVVSNTPWGSPPGLWRHELQRMGLREKVDAAVFCGDVGWRKPAAPIFERAASLLDVPVDRCLFVGDDVEWDIAGAADVGMRSFLLDRDDRHPDFTCERIHSLTELVQKLGAEGS